MPWSAALPFNTSEAVATELGALIQAATDAGHVAGSSVSFDKQTTYSLEQAALDLNISTRYLGTDVRSELSYEQSVEEHTLTAYFVQKMFTASMVLPQTPAELFSDAFTTERLQEQVDLGRVGPANPPVYISSVVYGRMLMMTMTSTHSIQEMEAALSATNASIGGTDIDTEMLDIINESRIQISTVGGVDDGVENLIRTGRLGDYFSADAPLTSARPLSYTVRNLSDNSIALVSETTTYNIRECQAVQGDPTGARYRVVLDKLRLIQDGCDGIFHPAPEVYYSYTLHYNGETFSLGSRSAGQAVVIEEGGEHTINGTARTVNLYGRGPASIRITGTAWDEDSNSNDEVIGTWDLSWTHAISSGQRYFTRSGGGCQIRLYLTITKLADLYD